MQHQNMQKRYKTVFVCIKGASVGVMNEQINSTKIQFFFYFCVV